MLPAKPKAKAHNTYPDLQLIQLWTSQKPNLIFVLLYIVLKKITTNTPSHRVWNCSWKSCTVHATYRLVTNLHADNKLICRLCWFLELTVGSQPMRRQIWVKCIIIRFNRLTMESTQKVLQCLSWTDKEGGEGGAATGGHILARAMLHVGSVRSWLSPLVQEDLLQVRIAWVFSPFF